MRSRIYLLAVLAVGFISCKSGGTGTGDKDEEERELELVWEDNFESGKLDESKWTRIPRAGSHWNRYMSYDESLVYFDNGSLVLEGKVNTDLESDESKYITGGVWTKDKFDFEFGRVDIKAKLGEAKGAWPALWMLPSGSAQWPYGGEIDIMEHLNNDEFVYQTVHTEYTYVHQITSPANSNRATLKRNSYNEFSFEWDSEELRWYVNGQKTFSYKRLDNQEASSKGQWPFDSAFYLLFSQQLGGSGTWVGEITDADLPVKMWIDYVKVYKYKD